MKKPDTLLTVNQVAHILGVHQQTVYKWIRLGELPCLRIGARQRWVRVAESELTRWQEARQWAA